MYFLCQSFQVGCRISEIRLATRRGPLCLTPHEDCAARAWSADGQRYARTAALEIVVRLFSRVERKLLLMPTTLVKTSSRDTSSSSTPSSGANCLSYAVHY